MHTRRIVFGLLAVSFITVGWLLADVGWRAGGTAASPASNPSKPRPGREAARAVDPYLRAQLRHELRAQLHSDLRAQLRAELLAELRAERQAIPQDGDAVAVPAPVETEALSPEEAARADQEHLAHRIAVYGDVIQTEPRDPEWSADIAAQLADTFAATEFAGVSVDAPECGSTLCRVEMTFEDPRVREQAEELIPLRPPFRTRGLIHSDDPQSLMVSVYFARQGHPLPNTDS